MVYDFSGGNRSLLHEVSPFIHVVIGLNWLILRNIKKLPIFLQRIPGTWTRRPFLRVVEISVACTSVFKSKQNCSTRTINPDLRKLYFEL